MNKYKNIYILDKTEKLNPFVRLLFRDLMGGFKRLGLIINETSSKEDVTNNSIIFMDNNVKKETIDFFYENITDYFHCLQHPFKNVCIFLYFYNQQTTQFQRKWHI